MIRFRLDTIDELQQYLEYLQIKNNYNVIVQNHLLSSRDFLFR